MTYIVAEPCVNCRYTDCAIPCPVEAFHLDDDMLVINPETCIDCDACVPECPVEAVFAEGNLPAEWSNYTQINADRALSGLPTIMCGWIHSVNSSAVSIVCSATTFL